MAFAMQFTPATLATAPLVDPEIQVTAQSDFTFTLSARGGVAPWTWLDHPFGTVGVFEDAETGLPLNAFYLVPGIDRTGTPSHLQYQGNWIECRPSRVPHELCAITKPCS